MPPKPLLYIQRDGKEAGPYDLVQLAGLLRKRIVSGETQSRLEGDDAWVPLSWQPLFSTIREMSPDADSMRLDELDEEALDRRSPIPLPSREFLIKLGAFVAGCLLLGAGAFLLAKADVTLGVGVQYIGLSIAIAASLMILIGILDEDWLKLGLIIFVPFYDLYYFICNFEKYALLLAVRYAALSVALGASLGLGR